MKRSLTQIGESLALGGKSTSGHESQQGNDDNSLLAQHLDESLVFVPLFAFFVGVS